MDVDHLGRQALLAEPDGLEYLVVGEALTAHGHAVAVEVFADGLAGDLELAGELVDRSSGPIARHQPGQLVRRQPSLRLSFTGSRNRFTISDTLSLAARSGGLGAKLRQPSDQGLYGVEQDWSFFL
jgi:hypothetical protein